MAGKQEIIQGVLEAWNRRDLEAIGPLLAPDFEWIEWEGSLIDAPAGRRGARAMERVTEDVDEGFEGYTAELVDYQELDDERVLVILEERATGSASGAGVSSQFGYIITVRDGKATRVVAYRDPAEARSAAGLDSAP